MEADTIEREIIPPLLKVLQSDHDEIVEKVSFMIGNLVFKLSKVDDLHLKYKDEFLEFYR
jgi:hypothetical protein